MSWNRSTKGNRHAIDSEAKAMFRQAKEDVDGHPPSLVAIRVHEDAVLEYLRRAPMHCHLTIASYGHFNHDGTGTSTLKVDISQEIPEVLTSTAAAEEPVTATEALLGE
ncbi:MAG TPA: hypothetical protein VEU74_12015 [Gemmatimonadales bacterium]|nr:hypothetical protein [Gemmatimonadales bacterium]